MRRPAERAANACRFFAFIGLMRGPNLSAVSWIDSKYKSEGRGGDFPKIFRKRRAYGA
jgi:hypothetical protein